VQRVADDLSLDDLPLRPARGIVLDDELELVAVDVSVDDRRVAERQLLRAGDLAVDDLELPHELDVSVRPLAFTDPRPADIRRLRRRNERDQCDDE
jgi:hypothetical protein